MSLNIQRILRIVSVFSSSPFIALLIPIYFLIIDVMSLFEFIHALIFLFIIPLFLPYYWSLRKGIEWDYPNRKERIMPFTMVTISYIIGFATISLSGSNFLVKCLHLSYAITSLTALMITMYYKVSIHIMGIIGPATFLFWAGYLVLSLSLIILSIVVSYARIKLKRHTLDQVIVAYIVALIVNTAVFHVYKLLS
ncbi:hypothetical protein J4526_09615 [Desulfurococcaceae archaeon MEX13E-LK6-19]|nr:hypothetical protein J4526_09615 [Desulfurococcaceae archaeon MEX13E-LK6-19]